MKGIELNSETMKMLDEIKGEASYDSIIQRCIIAYQNNKAFEEWNTQIWQGNAGCGYLKIQFPKNLKGDVEISLTDIIEDIRGLGDDVGVNVTINGTYFLHLPVDLSEKLDVENHEELRKLLE